MNQELTTNETGNEMEIPVLDDGDQVSVFSHLKSISEEPDKQEEELSIEGETESDIIPAVSGDNSATALPKLESINEDAEQIDTEVEKDYEIIPAVPEVNHNNKENIESDYDIVEVPDKNVSAFVLTMLESTVAETVRTDLKLEPQNEENSVVEQFISPDEAEMDSPTAMPISIDIESDNETDENICRIPLSEMPVPLERNGELVLEVGTRNKCTQHIPPTSEIAPIVCENGKAKTPIIKLKPETRATTAIATDEKVIKREKRVKNTPLNRVSLKGKRQSSSFPTVVRPKPDENTCMTLSTALKRVRSKTEHSSTDLRRANDVSILPPDNVDELTDEECVNEEELLPLRQENVKDVVGHLETHHSDSEDSENDERKPSAKKGASHRSLKFPEVKQRIGDIVSSEATLNDKVKSVISVIENTNDESCWRNKPCSAHNLLPKDSIHEMTDEVKKNRKKLAYKHGGKEPLEIWDLMMDEIVDLITYNTNDYAKSKNDPYFTVTKTEIRNFIGILLLSGYHNIPQIALMWDSDSDCGIADVKACMTRNRFWRIKKYIHFCDNERLDKDDKFAKVRPLFQLLNKKVKQFGSLDNTYSVDEQMIPYTGMHSAKQTNREKTIRFGYKAFWITTKDGYPIECIPYVGKKGICGESGKDLTARVTLQLVLSAQLSPGDLLFFDNWYSSYKLFCALTAMNIRATATIRADRLNFWPNQIEGRKIEPKKPKKTPLFSSSMMKKCERGGSEIKYDKYTGVNVVSWNDNGLVTVISNSFSPESESDVERFSKKQKEVIKIKRPESIEVYNKGMGGVDLLDSRVAVYRIKIRGKKWYWPLFVNTLDCLKAASFMSFQLANPGNDMTFLQFIRRVTQPLLKANGHDTPIPKIGYLRQAKWKGDSRTSNDTRLDKTSHWPRKQVQRRCAVKGCNRKPCIECDKCGVNLCVVPCFKIWHTRI